MRSFFHCCSESDQERLLDPERHYTEPWGADDHGPCDKCGGEGTALYECRSCLERGAEADCPACAGRVRFVETCPTCEGSGVIDNTRRRGIAAFPTAEGLYRYLAERDAEAEGSLIVELEGRLSDERDLDADCGALLLHPERIVAARPLDPEIVAAVRRRLAVEGSAAPGIDSA